MDYCPNEEKESKVNILQSVRKIPDALLIALKIRLLFARCLVVIVFTDGQCDGSM